MSTDRRERLATLAAQLGTPSYVYFLDEARARARALRDAFEGAMEVSFAVKSNPSHEVLVGLRGHVDALDVSSGGELVRGVEAGWPASTISFTGPGKREEELRASVDHGIGEVILESAEEAEALSQIALASGKKQRVLVRIAPSKVPPGFGDTMSGKPVAFGIDEEELTPFLKHLGTLEGVQLVGFHAYSGTQCLRADAIVANWQNFANLFVQASETAGVTPERFVFGAGFGIRYHDNQEDLDLGAVAEGAMPIARDLQGRYAGVKLALETGRYVIGEAGVLLTKVLRTKDSRGSRIGICDSGLHHHLAAAGLFGMVLKRNYRMMNVSAPEPGEEDALEKFQLSGPLCTSIDVLGRNVKLPRLHAGDIVAIECSGAYGASVSPAAFISHPSAKEWVVDSDGTRRGEPRPID